MRVKESHSVKVQGQLVYHDLHPVYYRVGKADLRLNRVWYCPDCGGIADMRDLGMEENKRLYLDRRSTSVFKRFVEMLKSKGEPGLSEEAVKNAGTEGKGQAVVKNEGLPEGVVNEISVNEESVSKTSTVSLAQDKYPGTARNAPCPCGGGKKYKRCHGTGASAKQ